MLPICQGVPIIRENEGDLLLGSQARAAGGKAASSRLRGVISGDQEQCPATNAHNASSSSDAMAFEQVAAWGRAREGHSGCPYLHRPAKDTRPAYAFNLVLEGLYTYVVEIGPMQFIKAGYFRDTLEFRGAWRSSHSRQRWDFKCDVPAPLRQFAWRTRLPCEIEVFLAILICTACRSTSIVN